MSSETRNVVIIGSGPAGLTACIYAARANLKPLLIEGFNAGGLIPGGQLMFTTDVENYPGFPEKVTGPELMQRFRDQAERQGTEIVTADVTKVDLSQRPFKVWDAERSEPTLAKTVIIATGARANYIGLPNEEKLKNKGVSACAVCDGALFRGKPVAVVGGGDTAMEEASYLAGLSPSVTLIHRRDEFRASKTMQKRVLDNPKITVLYSHEVRDVLDVSRRLRDRPRSREHEDQRAAEDSRRRRSSSPSDTRRCPSSSPGKSLCIRTATSRPSRARPRPASRACSPAATCRIGSTAKR